MESQLQGSYMDHKVVEGMSQYGSMLIKIGQRDMLKIKKIIKSL